MAQTENPSMTKFHAFLKQKDNKTNVAMQEAQKLINLYRALGVFGSEFIDQYNVMLLNSSDEVQMALNALVSGQEVRQYLEFLQQEENGGRTDKGADKNTVQTGWLPSPEDEAQQSEMVAAGGGAGPSKAELTSYMKSQEEKIAKVITSLNEEKEKQEEANKAFREKQEMLLKNLADQFIGSVQVRSGTEHSKTEVPEGYSEIIEEKR